MQLGAFAGPVSWAQALVSSLSFLCCSSFSSGHLQPEVASENGSCLFLVTLIDRILSLMQTAESF